MLSIIIICITILAYLIFRKIYLKGCNPLLNPLLLSMVLAIVVIKLEFISYDEYRSCTSLIDAILKPAILTLAIPLYKQIQVIRKNFKSILLCCTGASLISIFTAILIAKLLPIDPLIVKSLAVRSITTPLAMSVTETIGGAPGLSAAIVMLVGILGSVFCLTLLKVFKINSPIAQGLAYGASAHVLGAASAAQQGNEQGAFASVALVVSGIITSILTPMIFSILLTLPT